ncbi:MULTISPECIES: hypothetical protein [unclassified Knoellia]|uniref:PGAP1-like alpha/beta domain-containing protein n=1 Tax=Knoellia altitudinis TaxID=3404795 RepID=UPI00360BC366
MSDDLGVTGGAEGIEVGIEDLRRASASLQRASDAVVKATPRETGVELPTPGVPVVGPDWGLGTRVLGAPTDLVPLVARCRHDLDDLVADVASAVERLRRLSREVASAAATYEWAEAAVRGLIDGVHVQAMATAWLVTELTGQAFGLLDEGSGWDVGVVPVSQTRSSPVIASADWLLSGLEGLSHDGSVRVVEVPVADGTTTWVVQVPGTHGGLWRGDEVPMDWPANVSLMLRNTGASKIAATKALEQAQRGRSRPGDRVVLAGFSQGGIVAAALASDPDFGRRHRVSHVVTAGSPIDQFPIPVSTTVLSLQHRADPVHALDVSPPPGRRHWTTVTSGAATTATGPFRFHDLPLYRRVAARADRSGDVSLTAWKRGAAPALTPAAGSRAVVHEFRSERRWQNRDS